MSRLLFEDMLDGALPERRLETLDAHLNGCYDCRGVLEQLRIVDALLLHANAPEPDPAFTDATMAAIGRMPLPRRCGTPLLAWLVAYLGASWVAFALAMIFAGPQTQAALGAIFGISASELAAIGSFARETFQSFDSSISGLTAISVGTLAFDVMLAVLLAVGYSVLRSRETVR